MWFAGWINCKSYLFSQLWNNLTAYSVLNDKREIDSKKYRSKSYYIINVYLGISFYEHGIYRAHEIDQKLGSHGGESSQRFNDAEHFFLTLLLVWTTCWTGSTFAYYSISQEKCTRFCCALLCCGYAIVHNEFTWSIYPYSSGLLCWHWGNR